ncbi:MAG: SAM-dependent methyltransferase [Chloroflexi bacterium]|nr:SAM-dependent methyltransferase [Chloroflexota bacterium]
MMQILPLEQELARRTAALGRITFAQFMEAALYWPNGGYYTQPRASGVDYFTAPAAHPAFGALLALQLEEMWSALGRPDPFWVIEPGAGWGHLARDAASYAQSLEPSFAKALRYVALDRAASPPPKPGATVHWLRAAGLPLKKASGCIVSNELFDAMPVHRVAMREGRLREIFVAQSEGRLAEAEGEPSTPALTQRLQEEGISLAEGQRAEVCLALGPWLDEASQALEQGFLVSIDYGHPARELYAPQRARGTLRCYYRHTLSANPYVHLGRQDMTAHVDFTALAAIGDTLGLKSYPLASQGRFLANLGLNGFLRRLAGAGLPQPQRDANRMAMLEIARAGGMGDFSVLVQYKGIPQARLTGLEGPSAGWQDRLARLPLPVLDGRHLAVMEARYPQATQGFEELWR